MVYYNVQICLLTTLARFKQAVGALITGSGDTFIESHDWPTQTKVAEKTAEDAAGWALFAPQRVDPDTYIVRCPHTVRVPKAEGNKPGVASIYLPYRLQGGPGYNLRVGSLSKDVLARLFDRVPNAKGYNDRGAIMSETLTTSNAPGNASSFYSAIMSGLAYVYPKSFPSPFYTGAVHRGRVENLFDSASGDPVYRVYNTQLDGDEAADRSVTKSFAATKEGHRLFQKDLNKKEFRGDCHTPEHVMMKAGGANGGRSDKTKSDLLNEMRRKGVFEYDYVEHGRELVESSTLETLREGTILHIINNNQLNALTITRGEPVAEIHAHRESVVTNELTEEEREMAREFPSPIALLVYNEDLTPEEHTAIGDYERVLANPNLTSDLGAARLTAAKTVGLDALNKRLDVQYVIPIASYDLPKSFMKRGDVTDEERKRKQAADDLYADGKCPLGTFTEAFNIKLGCEGDKISELIRSRGWDAETTSEKAAREIVHHRLHHGFWKSNALSSTQGPNYYNMHARPEEFQEVRQSSREGFDTVDLS